MVTSQENLKRLRAKLAGLKRTRRFISRRETPEFAGELEALLEDMKAGISDPRAGAELVAAFYETDRAVFGQCDDSDGIIGDVFRHEARELFVHYASRCEEKQWLAQLVLKLNRDDGYGVRDSLIDCAASYLPESIMRDLVARLWELAGEETDVFLARHWFFNIESLARQLKDAHLFEKARLAAWPELTIAACLDIAGVYLDVGDAETALSWIERVPKGETFKADERDRLLLAVGEKLGDREKMTEAAWRIFRRHRGERTLNTLLDVIGPDQRERVVAGEAQAILRSGELSYSDASFLIQAGRIDDAETHLLDRADQLNGDLYSSLLPLAKNLERDGRFMAASVIYRALLDSILRRAQSKYYPYGVRYLKKLDSLAGKVANWRGALNHQAYVEKLRQAHGRKSSFWSRYET